KEDGGRIAFQTQKLACLKSSFTLPPVPFPRHYCLARFLRFIAGETKKLYKGDGENESRRCSQIQTKTSN
ncbi:hypothetical protein, partial [Geobacillus sp. T6]|uniref:hypothetical protein n=2 Tax=Anoxybacillaceae TaxID=3120669 RepID=UPI0019D70093